MSVGDLLAEFPAEQGLGSVVGYVALGARHGEVTVGSEDVTLLDQLGQSCPHRGCGQALADHFFAVGGPTQAASQLLHTNPLQADLFRTLDHVRAMSPELQTALIELCNVFLQRKNVLVDDRPLQIGLNLSDFALQP